MSDATASLKAQLDLHTRLFNNVLEGVNDTDANTRNSEQINHIKWVAGHLLNSRVSSLSKVTGLPHDDSYIAQFARGSALEPGANYPPLSQIIGKWNETASGLSNALAHVPDEVLAAPSPSKAPIADDTVRGLLSFLLSHEAYHIGQLSILRKLAGKTAMAYN